MAQNDRVNEKATIATELVSTGGFVSERRAIELPACTAPLGTPCILQQARDRYLASGFGHAMGFDSPPGRPALEPSGPLSDPRHGLYSPRLLESLAALLTR